MNKGRLRYKKLFWIEVYIVGSRASHFVSSISEGNILTLQRDFKTSFFYFS